jgi:hypothetical protein
MLTISSYTVELIKDPFGILSGERYEFLLDIEVEEDDDLYSDKGLYLKVIYLIEEDKTGMIKHDFYEKSTDKYLDFELEDNEKEEIAAFCKAHLSEALDN